MVKAVGCWVQLPAVTFPSAKSHAASPTQLRVTGKREHRALASPQWGAE